jgi:SAM-dependent methyltransferase
VACDGPNPERPGEAEKVAATRAVIEAEIDWPCQIECLYSETNQGCGVSVSHAINWFFSHVEEGIILEDDCVPHPDFFPYCEELLERYRNDTRIWCISGSNFQNGRWRGNGSYYFSRYPHSWGWATWRHRWSHYDADLSQWPALKESGLLGSIFENPREARYWTRIWDRLLWEGKPDSWAYKWALTCLLHGGLTALPNRNLVCNVGFGNDASHTKDQTLQRPIHQGLGQLLHPELILRDLAADRYTFSTVFDSTLKARLANRIKRLGQPCIQSQPPRESSSRQDPFTIVTTLRSLANPYWLPRKNIENAIASFQPLVHGNTLDFGCGSMPYKHCFPHVSAYTGLELDHSLAKGKTIRKGNVYFYDGSRLPFPDNTFDAVVSFQVLEHVQNAKHSIAELKRVSKPGAIFLLTAPLLWPEHETPHDYRRFTRWSYQSLCAECGLEVKHIQPLGTIYDVLIVFFLDYVSTHRSPLMRMLSGLLAPGCIALAFLLGRMDRWARRYDRFSYLDALVVASVPL